MKLDSRHPEYAKRCAQWKKCRDVFEGSDAVKESGESYLPRPSAQTTAEYHAYKERALFYGAFPRTIGGLVGSIARKPARLSAPEGLMFVEDDITGTGVGIGELIKTLTQEQFVVGRAGVLVDFDESSGRAFVTYYTAEQVINWFPGGETVIEEVVCERSAEDPFKLVEVKQWRHLNMVDGRYTVSLWRKRSNGFADDFYLVETMVPSRRGKPLSYIPFYPLSPQGATLKIEKPPLLDLAEVVISHYRTSADLEHGRHYCGMPLLYITGQQSDDAITIGGGHALVLGDPAAKVGYASFDGSQLGTLEKGLADKENQMAVLGAKLFAQKAGVESAETARIRANAENCSLSSIASSTEEVLELALRAMADWMGLTGDIDLKINRDFIGERISAQEVVALLKAFSEGALSLESFLENLKVGQMLAADMDIEQEAKELQAGLAARVQEAALLAAKAGPQPASKGPSSEV